MLRFVFAVACLVGCAAESEPESCPALRGSYLIHMVEKSGTCGELNDQIVLLPVAPNPSCVTERSARSVSGCTTEGSITCTTPNGTRITERGTCRYTSDGLGGVCEVQIVFRFADGSSCSGIYEEQIRKQ